MISKSAAAFRPAERLSADVLVVGAGLAGILAAITAAEAGRQVLLTSAGPIFSGSSFYPGTWGLGLVAPENPADTEEFIQTILTVGCGMAEEPLVRTLVGGITPAIGYLRGLGVELKQAEREDQKDFIPCFDHKRRSWNGILFESARQALAARMAALPIRQLPRCQVLNLLRCGERVAGALAVQSGRLVQIDAGAVVLATGGFGGLYARHLTTDDVGGAGQALALAQGCHLVNLEFMQMMAGYLSPCPKTIFNERTFRYTTMRAAGRDIFADLPNAPALLAARSAHGPFTARLPTRAVDLALVAAERQAGGVEVRYLSALATPEQEMPEFIRTYFDWLRVHKGLTPADPVTIGMYAHAANGGIQITPGAATARPGLFACGEVTGGMHGADRIGGLSSANGLVFGRIAGRAAAEYARERSTQPLPEAALPAVKIENATETRQALGQVMARAGMVVRTEAELTEAATVVRGVGAGCRHLPAENPVEAAETCQLENQLLLAQAILAAQTLRRESRGAHYRADYPEENPALARQILVRLQNNRPLAAFKEDHHAL